jgi:phosphate:Na+ symporter
MAEIVWPELLVGLAGGLAMFLLGIQQLTRALQNLSSGRLRETVARLSSRPLTGAASGAATTAIIQSSTATMVLLIGFASAGLITVRQAVPVVLGANVGTTLTMQIIAFDVTRFALLMIAVGFAVSMVDRWGAAHEPAAALLALGLVFLGMDIMAGAVSPLREASEVLAFLAGDANVVVAMLIGAAFTAVVQSSSATSGVLIVLASQGLLDLRTGIAMALGATIGTCITTYLAAIGRPRPGQRVGAVHVLVNVVGVAIWMLLIPQLEAFAVWLSPSAPGLTGAEREAAEVPRQLANAYTTFKVVNLLFFLGLAGPVAAVVTRLLPDRPDEERIGARYLDEDALDTPDAALGLARLELVRLGEETVAIVDDALPTVLHGTYEQLDELADRDHRIDAIHEALLDYLGRIGLHGLSTAQAVELFAITSMASDFESIGDIVEINLVELGKRRLEEAVLSSGATTEAVTSFHATLVDRLRQVVTAIDRARLDLAWEIVGTKREVTEQRHEVMGHLTRRLRADLPNRVHSYEREMELVGHLQRIAGLTRHIARTLTGDRELPGASELARRSDGTGPAHRPTP